MSMLPGALPAGTPALAPGSAVPECVLPEAGTCSSGSTTAEQFADSIGQALAALSGLAGMTVTVSSGAGEAAAEDVRNGTTQQAPDPGTTTLGAGNLVAALFPTGVPIDAAVPQPGSTAVPPSSQAPDTARAVDRPVLTSDGSAATLRSVVVAQHPCATTDRSSPGIVPPFDPQPQTQHQTEELVTRPTPGHSPTSTDDSAAPDTVTSTVAALSSAPTQHSDGASPPALFEGTSKPAGDATVTPPATTHVGPAASAPPAAPAAPAPVAAQLFTALTELVQRGDGSHRITLELAPAALGEVRVVLTVRAGVVHVQLAAGEVARRALREGSPELTRMLEQIGATETRVVLRELPPALAANTAGRPDQGDPGPHSGTHPGTPHSGDRQSGDHQSSHAGTRAPTLARDGPHQHQPRSRGASLPEPNHPVTWPRLAGVDVTI